MNNRMHPEDLRTFVAGLNLTGIIARGSSVNPREIVETTDALLGELARTAKPEPEPRIVFSDSEAMARVVARAKTAEAERDRLRGWLVNSPEFPKNPLVAEGKCGWCGEPMSHEVCRCSACYGKDMEEAEALEARAEKAEARVRELEAEDVKGHQAYARLSQEKAALVERLAAIDVAKAELPGMPAVFVPGIVRERALENWGLHLADLAAALRVDLAEMKANESRPWDAPELEARAREEGRRAGLMEAVAVIETVDDGRTPEYRACQEAIRAALEPSAPEVPDGRA